MNLMEAGLSSQEAALNGEDPAVAVERYMRAVLDTPYLDEPIPPLAASLAPAAEASATARCEDWLYFQLNRARRAREAMDRANRITDRNAYMRERHEALGAALLHYRRLEAAGIALDMTLAQLWQTETTA